ncbi:hypothetical protein [Novosphingobium album (ex Liu et al. 2023)]|uniref:Uncharacterized protein n=1 Tax=Novosphingobium album (ex Liu et al. 2023) TaxID=3031130 RepID=A0ABT5WQA9_9SPHN|nr:hypothetical protein [Novosphingobium album (ex Liu et al. 2023)]MDE8652224.1 hypothetical protein [Novosphingobium album (ex Liu et al. 2023)]
MGLSERDIGRIDALLAALGKEIGGPAAACALGRLVPHLPNRQCDAADVLETPFREAGGFDLHLLDTSGHCIRVTGEPAEATALLIATKAAS